MIIKKEKCKKIQKSLTIETFHLEKNQRQIFVLNFNESSQISVMKISRVKIFANITKIFWQYFKPPSPYEIILKRNQNQNGGQG